MLTRVVKVSPETILQLADHKKAGVKVSPRALILAIPERAEQIILKALSYRPADRPQRARDFGGELARALTEDDFSAATVDPESTRSTLIKPKDKQAGTKSPVPLWMIAALVLLAVGIIGAIVWLKSGSGSNQQAGINNTNTVTTTAT